MSTSKVEGAVLLRHCQKDGLSKCLQSQTQYLGEKSTHHTKKKLHLQKEKTIINT